MNDQLQEFARSELKAGLAKCTDGNRRMFNRMYSHEDLDADVNNVVDRMPADKLESAMDQVRRTLIKNGVLDK